MEANSPDTAVLETPDPNVADAVLDTPGESVSAPEAPVVDEDYGYEPSNHDVEGPDSGSSPENDEYVPPTRDEYEALLRLIDDDDTIVPPGANDAAPPTAEQTAPAQEQQAAFEEPTFDFTQEEFEAIQLGEGEEGVKAFRNVLTRHAEAVEYRTIKAMAPVVQQYINTQITTSLPAALAINELYRNHPQAMKMPKLVDRVARDIRKQNPTATDLEIVAGLNDRLGPILRQAGRVADSGRKINSNVAAPGAATPSARQSAKPKQALSPADITALQEERMHLSASSRRY